MIQARRAEEQVKTFRGSLLTKGSFRLLFHRAAKPEPGIRAVFPDPGLHVWESGANGVAGCTSGTPARTGCVLHVWDPGANGVAGCTSGKTARTEWLKSHPDMRKILAFYTCLVYDICNYDT